MIHNLKLAGYTLWRQIASLFFLLLVISAGVSFFLGEKNDGIIISVILLINTILGFFQEFRASRASEKLLHLVETKVYVLRSGNLVQIPVSELLVDDVVHLVAGSIAPVDLEIIESDGGFIDDSVRTGESMPKPIEMGQELSAGGVVSAGKLIGRVLDLEKRSSLAQYREKLQAVKKWSSFTVFVNKVIRYIFVVSIIVLLLSMIFLVFVLGKYNLASFFVFAIAMLVGVVPEVLPLIITIILTKESLLLSKDKVIVKRLSSLQGLGAVRFLLSDKTGTITENKLRVRAVNDANNFWEASNAISEGEYERPPMDEAYDAALNASLGKIKTAGQKITSFQPFTNEVGYELFTLDDGDRLARGQMEKIFALCPDASPELRSSAEGYETKGMRVIALARGRAGEWNFTGFVAFEDPIKDSAGPSLRLAHERGIGVKILTGDSEAVSENVAEELGLIKSPDNIINLENVKVSDLSQSQLMRAVVFSKCTPENKLELIDRYLALGPVAFIGDGINDALGLARADIGIAVDNAADIAKESADIILLEKDLTPVLKSVATGRRALRNILTYIIYTLSGNAGTFISILVAAFFYPVLPMLPIQILLNNLLTDLPLMLIITDNADEYAMRHAPHFQPKKLMKRVLIFGGISSLFDFVYFQAYKHVPVADFQTGWFLLSVWAELALILSIRSSRSLWKSPPLSMPLAIGIAVSALIPFAFIYNKTLAGLFQFSALSLPTLFAIIAILLIYVSTNEFAKAFMRRRNLYNKPAVAAKIFK
ncbi:MAG TPA: HAD-IC family P-type ATPase [Candidatus Paceibacterota bacterium]|nr:HAD-IC family P-type ATPase [Candidatus Paceibacterota bacterium]